MSGTGDCCQHRAFDSGVVDLGSSSTASAHSRLRSRMVLAVDPRQQSQSTARSAAGGRAATRDSARRSSAMHQSHRDVRSMPGSTVRARWSAAAGSWMRSHSAAAWRFRARHRDGVSTLVLDLALDLHQSRSERYEPSGVPLPDRLPLALRSPSWRRTPGSSRGLDSASRRRHRRPSREICRPGR